MSLEIWKQVPGYGGHYEASSLGNIRSKDRIVRKFSAVAGKVVDQKYKGRMLNPCSTKEGYRVVRIGVDGKKYGIQVGRMVLMAFKGLPPEGTECCHNNGNPADNRIENLRWDTHLENNRDRARHGTYALGEEHHSAKLDSKTVKAVYESEGPVSVIAEQFGLKENQVSRIRRGELWGSVTGGTPRKTIFKKRKTDKLDSAKAEEIRNLWRAGKDKYSIAEIYGVTWGTVNSVIKGKTWANKERYVVDCEDGANG